MRNSRTLKNSDKIPVNVENVPALNYMVCGPPQALNVCFPCEYDAAPGVGHAATHNLCTEASVAAALAIKRCIQEKMFPRVVRLRLSLSLTQTG